MKSLNPSLYPVIFQRKSTRSYRERPIPDEQINQLQAFISEIIPLFPSEKAAFKIQPHKGNRMKISAYAISEPAAYFNLAFMMQQIDLFIQMSGMGSLWNGTIRATENEHQGLPYGICLVFGMPKENPVRTGINQFQRKPAEEISNKPELPFVDAVRLAPSTRNKQPWYLLCENKRIDLYCMKGGFLDRTLLQSLHWLDIGIAACHAVLALQKEGFSITVFSEPHPANQEGYRYCLSLKIERKQITNE